MTVRPYTTTSQTPPVIKQENTETDNDEKAFFTKNTICSTTASLGFTKTAQQPPWGGITTAHLQYRPSWANQYTYQPHLPNM